MENYEKLKKIIATIDSLLAKNITSDAPEFIAWHKKHKGFCVVAMEKIVMNT